MGQDKGLLATRPPLTGLLGNSPELRVVHVFLSAPEHEYTKVDLAEAASVARATLDRVLEGYLAARVVVPAREVGHITLYRLNAAEPVVQALSRFVDEATSLLAEKASKGHAKSGKH